MKNCENYNPTVVIFVHHHIQLLCAQLKASNWDDSVQQLWEGCGMQRLTNVLGDHSHPQIAQYVVETKISQLIKDLEKYPRKNHSLRNEKYERAMGQLQIDLIPSYFVRKCNKQIDELINLSAQPIPQTKGQP